MIDAQHFEDTYQIKRFEPKIFLFSYPPPCSSQKIVTEGSLQNSDNVFCFALVLLLCMALLIFAQFANGSQSQRWNRARRENCFNIWQNFSSAAFKILPFPNQLRLT